jgi:hypothetical protein
MEIEAVTQLADKVEKLGIAGVLVLTVILMFTVWQIERKRSDTLIEKSNETNSDVLKMVAGVIQDNAVINTQMKASLDAQKSSLDAQTQMIGQLGDRLTELVMRTGR